MGRELRMVPPNWNHPNIIRRNGREGLQPMRSIRFEVAAKEWKEGFEKWEAGERPSYCSEECKSYEYWEYSGMPPEREYYQAWKDEDATWFQLWETVSEGTPVSPPFATKEELIDYLVANGDFWDQSRRKEGVTSIPCGPWSREQAESVVGGAYCPSMAIVNFTEEVA